MTQCSGSHTRPPILDPDGVGYSIWKNDISLWCQITKTHVDDRAPNIYLELKGNARRAAQKILHDRLRSRDGVKILLEYLDEAFIPNKAMRLFNANNKLRNVIRKPNEKVKDYIIEFDNAKFLLEQEGLEKDDILISLDLLQQCQLPQDKNHLVMSGLTEVTYEKMKEKLSTIFFDDHDTSNKFGTPGCESSSQSEVLYTNAYGRRDRGGSNRARSMSRGRKRFRYERGAGNNFGRSNSESQPSFRTKNPVGDDGQISRCNICQSILHWARQCPHSWEKNQGNHENDFETKSKQVNFNLLVAMFTGYAREEDDRLNHC